MSDGQKDVIYRWQLSFSYIFWISIFIDLQGCKLNLKKLLSSFYVMCLNSPKSRNTQIWTENFPKVAPQSPCISFFYFVSTALSSKNAPISLLNFFLQVTRLINVDFLSYSAMLPVAPHQRHKSERDTSKNRLRP